MRTLCIDIGGTGIKTMVLDESGKPLGERVRIETPQPATPEAVLEVIDQLVARSGSYDRISAGFPGVVSQEGVVKTAPNLDPSFGGFPLREMLERRYGKPARLINDAVLHGLGVVEGRGVELVITLGTGMGCALYVDGHPAGLELAHHPLKKGKTYEERVGNQARRHVGNPRWNKRVRAAIAQMDATFNYRRLYLGGGNVKHLERDKLPSNVQVVENLAGLLGGYRLWQVQEPTPTKPLSPSNQAAQVS